MFMQYKTVAVVAVALMVTPLAGCGWIEFFDELGAARTFKDANLQYSRGRYPEAIELYEEVVVVLDESGTDSQLLQQLTAAYFYIGNSYDSLYQPNVTDPENLHILEEAIRYYQLASEKSPTQSLRDLSMQYLVSTFGSDKANDPSRAEPVLREMILEDPENPDNYFRLAQLYEESGLYQEATAVYEAVLEFQGNDPTVHQQIAGFYNRAGEFELTMEALEEAARLDSDNPEAFYTISTYYWEKAFKDFRITDDQKFEYIMRGIDATDRALNLNDRYLEALVYKNILLRMQANTLVCEDSDDTVCIEEQDGLIAQADELLSRAQQLQREQRAQPPPPAA